MTTIYYCTKLHTYLTPSCNKAQLEELQQWARNSTKPIGLA